MGAVKGVCECKDFYQSPAVEQFPESSLGKAWKEIYTRILVHFPDVSHV